jgi:hypothetical protein
MLFGVDALVPVLVAGAADIDWDKQSGALSSEGRVVISPPTSELEPLIDALDEHGYAVGAALAANEASLGGVRARRIKWRLLLTLEKD